MRKIALVATLLIVPSIANAETCSGAASAEFNDAMNTAFTYMAGAHLCAPLIGDAAIGTGRTAVENILLIARFPPDEIAKWSDTLEEKAKKEAAGRNAESLVKGQVIHEDVKLACYQELTKALRQHETARAKFRAALCRD